MSKELEENGELELTLDSDTFEGVRKSFDIVMQRLMKSMADTNSDEAKITITVDVKLDTDFVPNYVDGKQNVGRDIKKPTFKHKVASAITVKDEASGNNNTEMELVYDTESKTYVLKPVMGGEQMTMADYLKQQSEHNDNEQSQNNGPALLEGNTPLLSGPVDSEDDVIEGEFREVDEPMNPPEDEEPMIDDGNPDDGMEYDEPESEEE